MDELRCLVYSASGYNKGKDKFKTSYHLVWPDLVVDADSAPLLRELTLVIFCFQDEHLLIVCNRVPFNGSAENNGRETDQLNKIETTCLVLIPFCCFVLLSSLFRDFQFVVASKYYAGQLSNCLLRQLTALSGHNSHNISC